MNIALDYDKTYTLDPDSWNKVVGIMRSAGHRVFCVTMRRESELDEINSSIANHVDAVYCTSREAKAPYMDRAGVKIDVWIDDSPYWLLNNG